MNGVLRIPVASTQGKMAPATLGIGVWVTFKSAMGLFDGRKAPCHCRISNSTSSSFNSIV